MIYLGGLTEKEWEELVTLDYVLTWGYTDKYKKEIHIKLPNIFKAKGNFGPDDPRWNDFQEFLKEREENERN